MPKLHEEPRIYKHRDLMDKLNDMCITIKIQMFDVGGDKAKEKNPKFTIEDLDRLHNEIHQILSEDYYPMRHF